MWHILEKQRVQGYQIGYSQRITRGSYKDRDKDIDKDKDKYKDKDKAKPTTQMHRAWLPPQQAHGLMDSANGGIADPCCSYFQREGD